MKFSIFAPVFITYFAVALVYYILLGTKLQVYILDDPTHLYLGNILQELESYITARTTTNANIPNF